MARQSGSRGNSIEDQQRFVQEALGRWRFDLDVQDTLGELYDGGVYVKSFRLVAPKNPGGNWLCVISASMEGSEWVAFITGDDCVQTLRDAITAVKVGKIKWQEDKYAKNK